MRLHTVSSRAVASCLLTASFMAPQAMAMALVHSHQDRDWPRYWRRKESERRNIMAAFMKARFEMEALIAAGELHKAYAKLPMATRRAHAANEFGMPIVWRDWLNVMGIERLRAAEALIERSEVAKGLLEIQALTVLRELQVGRDAIERMREARRDATLQQALVEADAEAVYQEAEDLIWRGSDLVAAAEEEARQRAQEALVPEGDRLPPLNVVEPYMFEPLAGPPVPDEVKAVWALRDDERVTLVETLQRVMDRYPETKAGFKAKWTLEALRSDARLWENLSQLRDEKAARVLLHSALNFRSNGRHDEAVAHLERIIRDYPHTAAAHEARELLKQSREH